MIPDVVEAIAYKIIAFKKGSEPTEDDETDYERLSYQICNWSIIVLVLVLGVVTNRAIESVFAICSFWTARMLTGGIHLPTLTLCVLASVILLTIISHVELSGQHMIFIYALSFVLILINREKQRLILLKRWDVIGGVAITLIGLFIVPGTVAVAVLAQALTLFGRR